MGDLVSAFSLLKWILVQLILRKVFAENVSWKIISFYETFFRIVEFG